ncbi:hypothetical protein AB4672_21340 [Bacillus paralicheniformis]
MKHITFALSTSVLIIGIAYGVISRVLFVLWDLRLIMSNLVLAV